MVLTANELDIDMVTGYEDHGSPEESMDASTLHEQLVRHVLVVSGELDSRSDVWGEHSYARARGAAANTQMRVLLAPAPAPPADDDDELLDVETLPRPLPAPPCDHVDEDSAGDDGEDEDEADDWEERLIALAPSAAHARLATATLAALRDLRLERLAAGGGSGGGGRWARGEGAAAAARRLRRALAPHWAGGAGGGAAWLHAALAGLPRALAPLYAEVLGELRRQVPRLAERLGAGGAAARDPLAAAGEARAADAPGPWLAWAPSGCAAEDARWLRRLGALVHARALCPPPPARRAPASPERWCASLAQEARAALADMVADAGRRAVVVGGAGSGAALAAWLAAGGAGGAGGTRVRGLLLLAPPLLTAEGPRDAPEDALADVDVPLLAVVGGGAAQCWRGAAAALAGAGAGAGAGVRRVLVVAGADDALRLPRTLRRRRNLPQHALDAALAEECARWVVEAAETPETPRDRSSRRRAAAPPDTDEGRLSTGGRSIEIIEGRVVSRGPAGAPLALLPPRLAAADIMQLPIVFADDEAPPPAAAAAAPAPALATAAALESDAVLTVRSGRGGGGGGGRGGGELRYTRVLVAKRGAGGGGGGGRAPAPRRRALHDVHEPRP